MRFIRFRNIITTLTVLIFFVAPYIKINNYPILFLDFPNLKLHFFGISVWFTDGIFIALGLIIIILVFLWVSVALGRVFCAFSCPQTITINLKNWVKKHTRNNPIAGTLAILIGTALGSFGIVSYFSAPIDILQNIINLDLQANNIKGLIVVYAMITAIALTDRRFCKTACPYAKFMLVLQTPHTMTTTYQFNRDVDCIRCSKCVYACPMDIDLKEGNSPDCINCGNCIVACKNILIRIKKPTLFHFSISRKSFTQLPSIALLTVILALTSVIITLALTWTPFKVDYLPSIRNADFSYYDGDILVNNYRISIENKRDSDESFYLIVRTPLDDINIQSPVYMVPAGSIALFPFELRIPPSVYRHYSKVTFTTYAIKTKEYTHEQTKNIFIP